MYVLPVLLLNSTFQWSCRNRDAVSQGVVVTMICYRGAVALQAGERIERTRREKRVCGQLWCDARLTCETAREPAMSEKFRLTVHVPKARNLTAADWNGFSDPYVILYVSDASKSQQTETVEANLNPGAWRAIVRWPLLLRAHSRQRLHLTPLPLRPHHVLGLQQNGRRLSSCSKMSWRWRTCRFACGTMMVRSWQTTRLEVWIC